MAGHRSHWDLLQRYRERYGLTSTLPEATSLQRTLERRQGRAHALGRRVEDLEKELEETRRKLRGARLEVEATDKTARLLIDHLIEEIRRANGEVWSPVAVLGFRLWTIRASGLFGYMTQWRSPHVTAVCLNRFPGDDVPHGRGCGPPRCGIYATKDVGFLIDGSGIETVGGYAIGVVGMSGKVVEHESGYRAAIAEVQAISLNCDGRNLNTDDVEVIERLFRQPMETLRLEGARRPAHRLATERFLNEWKENQACI